MMKRTFDIKRSSEIEALCFKYDNYAREYIPGEEEDTIFALIPKLTEWEKVVLYALTEYKSFRRIAKVFGITEYRAKETIRDIRLRIKELLNEN